MAADTCRLCLRSVDKEKSSNLLTETTKLGMLKEFLPELNLDFSENTQVCDRCVEELETSYNFKQGVVVNEANIQAKLEGKKQKKIDLKLMLDAIAKKELKKSDYICRTCLSICRTPSISLFESPSNMMPYSFVKKMCEVVFELEFIASTKPVLCDDCWETLQTVYNFRKSCLRTDKRLRVYVASNNITKLSVDEFKKFAEENPVKDDDEVSSDDELDGYVKDEPLDEEELKFDPDEASCSSSSVKVKEETIVKCESEINSDDEDIEDEPELLDPKAVKSEASELDGEDCKMEIGDVKVDAEGEGVAGTSGEILHNPGRQHVLKKCLGNKLTQNTLLGKCKRDTKTLLSISDEVRKLTCPHCAYRAKHPSSLKRHLVVHQSGDTSEKFICPHCSFWTKHKESLKRHIFFHQPADAVEIFSCPQCSFKTNYKSSLKLHALIHQSEDTVQMFSCTQCLFKTKRKDSLSKHLAIHRSAYAVEIFYCAHCSYKTKLKTYLRQHLLNHQPDEVVQMFSCIKCSFKTRYSGNFNHHVLTHQPAEAVQTFNCTQCSYRTKYRSYLKKHALTHQSDDAVQNFHCAHCSFKTKRKDSLPKHLNSHQSDFLYSKCSPKIKSESALKRHVLSRQPNESV